MNHLFLWNSVGMAAAAVNLCIAFLVFVRKDYSGHRAFAGISFCLSGWHICHVMAYPEFVDPFWMRALFSSLIFIPALAFSFVNTLLDRRIRSISARAWTLAGAVFFITLWTPLFDTSWWRRSFVLFEFPPLLYCLAKIILAAIQAKSPERRNGLLYLSLGSGLAVIGGLVEFLPRFGLPPPPFPVGSASIAVYTVMVAYAIRRHQLLNIRAVVQRGMALGGIAVVAGGLSSLAFWLDRTLLGWSWGSLFVILYAYCLVTLVFWDKWGDNLKGIFLADERQRGVRTEAWMRSLSRILSLDALFQSTQDFIISEIGTRECLIELFGPSFPERRKEALTWPDFLAQEKGALTSRDLQLRSNDPNIAELSRAQLHRIISFMGEHRLDVLVPILSDQGIEGIIGLGERSEGFYDVLAVGWLCRIAACLGQALQDFRIRQELLHADRLVQLGLLAGGIAHEIRNPLSFMKMGVDLFGMRETTEEQKEKMRQGLDREIDRLNRLVEDLLSFAKPRAAKPKPCEIGAVIEEVMRLVLHGVNSGIAIKWKKPVEPIYVRMDSDHLKQIVLNLVRNSQLALTSSKKGREIRIEASGEDGTACVRVSDDGPGIPKEVESRLFQVFASGSERGTGFGLKIVDELVRLYHGKISVHSEPGQGATFVLRFPMSAAEAVAPQGGNNAG